MEERFETRSSESPIAGSRFAQDIEQMLGDDLEFDPLFLEECWAFGKSAALENLHRRRQWQIERDRQTRAALEIEDLEMLYASRAAALPERRDASQVPNQDLIAATREREVSSECWKPQDWVPLDRFRQSWIPEGWMPEMPRPKEESSEQKRPVVESVVDSMTIARAQQILDITSVSTREQVRSAYRRKVTEFHPDRMQDATEADRELANQRMSAINEAYRLLCCAMLQAA